jgi:hypothetical protein
MKKFVVVDLFICFFFVANAQYATLYPANWYIGMKWNKVQVIVKSNDSLLHHQQVQINYPGVQLKKVHSFENGKYLALDIVVSSSAKPGNVNITLQSKGTATSLKWVLKARREGAGKQFVQGVNGKERVRTVPAHTGAEDFSFFQQKVPGFFFFLGARPDNKTGRRP